MTLKKKLGMGIASAALGISLIGGGTFAYFNSTATSNNTFAAGTIDLAVDPVKIFNVSNLKPGDKMFRQFELKNSGTLNIAKVLMDTSYEVTDAKGNNGTADFGHHIKVKFLENEGRWPDGFDLDGEYNVVYEKTLAELTAMTPDDLAKEYNIFGLGTNDGIKAGGTDYLSVLIEFVDQGDQNIFQGDSLQLEWKFTGEQEAGTNR